MLSKGRISHITISRYSERSHTLSNTKLYIWVLQRYNQVQADLPLIEWCSRNPNLAFLHVWNSPALLPSNHSSFIKESKFILEFAMVCRTLWSTQFLSSPVQSPLKEPDTWFKVRLLPKMPRPSGNPLLNHSNIPPQPSHRSGKDKCVSQHWAEKSLIPQMKRGTSMTTHGDSEAINMTLCEF